MKFGKVLLFTMLLVVAAQPAGAEHAGPFATAVVDHSAAKYNAQIQVSGHVKVQGSDTMHPLMSRLATEFQWRQPQVTMEAKGGGSSKAVSEFLQPPAKLTGRIALKEERPNHVMLVSSSRELTDSEIKQFVSYHGYEPVAIPVAIDAVALYVHKDNPLPGLTKDQADAIFSTTHNRGHQSDITQWGQLGLIDGWENAPIQLYGRDRKSGTYAFFQEHVLAGGEFKPSLQDQPGSASVVLALSRAPKALGYGGLGLQHSGVRPIPLAENDGMPFVLPSAQTIANETYPLSRVLYVYIDKSPDSSLPVAAREFLAFIHSADGQEAITKAGFFPLPLKEVKSLIAVGLFPVSTTSHTP